MGCFVLTNVRAESIADLGLRNEDLRRSYFAVRGSAECFALTYVRAFAFVFALPCGIFACERSTMRSRIFFA